MRHTRLAKVARHDLLRLAVQEVEVQTLTAYARAEGSTEAVAFQLEAAPSPHDARGKTSLFLGRLPKELGGKRVEVTVPSIRIAGERNSSTSGGRRLDQCGSR